MKIKPYIIDRKSLSDDLLIQCYYQAIRLNCDERFIQILKDSIQHRSLVLEPESSKQV
ncbi:sporulation histidine kinase inhibitor Sda [Paenibacillus sp. GCM10012307]|uniref:Sporulation histidine kinase inhibitor Sda n=1 Tax=Paenibacillus roseus TaxID=2798579 RepID=A0A934J987_9BACL|nr:sporulation histidine kinase inhibitor Sda [Paenibacillus roseus]MBJ6362690.1 sporulation histidine kinase inhibitor Sda [Paenibacillus roseus]